MIISLIAAMDEQAGIGKNSTLPWHLSSDLKRFKRLTMGHYIAMGRKTYETIGRTLPGRKMIILTRQSAYQVEDCQVANSLDAAIQLAKNSGENELFIIGGGEIFIQAISIADKIYLTRIHTKADTDVFFPAIDFSHWDTIDREMRIQEINDEYSSDFFVYKRKC